MRTIALAVGLLVVGCGGMQDGGQSTDPLLGSWALTTSGGCVSGKTFAAGGQFESDLICTLSDGRTSTETQLGTYVVANAQITFYTSKSTCTDTLKAVYFGLAMTGPTEMSLIATDGVLVYQKVSAGGGNGVLVFGCWESDGLFHEMPLATLP